MCRNYGGDEEEDDEEESDEDMEQVRYFTFLGREDTHKKLSVLEPSPLLDCSGSYFLIFFPLGIFLFFSLWEYFLCSFNLRVFFV